MFDLHPVERPYPGLRPFEPHEGEIFFGRERHTDRLLEILQRERFLAVVGPSGGGKSSLVRAGLLPALAGGRLGTGSHWRLALLRPGAQPQLALAQSLIGRHALGLELAVQTASFPGGNADTTLAAATAEQATADAALVAAELRRDEQGLARVLNQAQAARRSRATGAALPTLNLLVLVDQFEELFTYQPAALDPGEAARFVGQLLRLCRVGDGPLAESEPGGIRVVVALTLRTDFLGHCVQFAELPEAINHAQYLTPRLRDDELRMAVVGPARLFGGDVDIALAEAAIAHSGGDADQLPMLQHALAQWWMLAEGIGLERPVIDSRCTEQAGDVLEALNIHAEKLFGQLVNEGLAVPCEWLFRAITSGREGADAVRRPQRLADVAAWSGVPVDTLMKVVRLLAAPGVSFLHHGPRLDADSVVDLAHEALMRQWDRLSGWVADELQRARSWQRWLARTEEHASGGGLLTGADLARALAWWNPDMTAPGGAVPWTPTSAWSRRYKADTLPDGVEPVLRLREFLVDSRTQAQLVEAVERQRQLDGVQRLEREKGERRFRIAVGIGLACAAVLLIAAGILWQNARSAQDIATQQAKLAQVEFKNARAAELRASDAAAQAQERLHQVTLVTQYSAVVIDAERLREAAAADRAIQQILLSATPVDVARRGQTSLEIWAKDIDRDNVRAALGLLGFPVVIRKANLTADPTNAVWAGTGIPADDTRLVALSLVRAGIAVRSVGPIQEWIASRDRLVIQAGAARDSINCRPFTVAELVSMTQFTRETRNHC